MNAPNSIARGVREPEARIGPIGLDLPPEFQSRYEVRLVEGAGSEPRIGLFRGSDREVPAIEITADRIVARLEDAETIDSLVRIAQHNGWDRIDVDGSPEFRKAIWAAAAREGLTVSGYEPSFAEQERLANARRAGSADRASGPAEQPSADGTRAERADRATSEPNFSDGTSADQAPASLAEEATPGRPTGEELADLFLHGAAERVAADPRLAGALQAQSAMEQHIGELFDGDAARVASATLESRQMISDVLRRGLDVSVREPTPIRQIEPVHALPDLER